MPTSFETSDGASDNINVASVKTNTEMSMERVHDQRVGPERTTIDQTGWCRTSDLSFTIRSLFAIEGIQAAHGDVDSALVEFQNERDKGKAVARADSDKVTEWLRKDHCTKREMFAS
ncbi:hypothetical protein JCM5353_008492 [Sporobolomyces roseus]